ncbi:MAG: hypothetical protein ABJ084_00940 [Halioglobus sp.]
MKNPKAIKTILIEVFSIVLGVMLALGVSEWQQEREYAQLADTALANVAWELRSNLEVLTRIHENNVETIELSEAETNDQSAPPEDRQFIPGVQVRSTAWDTLLSSGLANHIDYKLLLSLSEIYSSQGIYRQMGLQIVEASMSMAAMATVNRTELDNEIFQEQFSSYFNMLLQMEEVLLEGYEETIASLAKY